MKDAAQVGLPRWLDHLLGQEPAHRVHMSQALLALGLCVGFALLGAWAARQAATPWPVVLTWASVLVLGQSALVAAIHTRWSTRWADPSLTLAQIVFTMLMSALIYPLVGELSTGVLPVFVLILSFSMFMLKERQTRWLSLISLGLVLLGMVLNHLAHGVPPSVQAIYFCVMVICVAGMSVLSARMNALRQRMRRQREDLVQALQRIEELAIRDGLTGLFNRRHGMELLGEALSRHARQPHPLHVLLLDLDHFKRINDVHGHGVGDKVLRAFGHTTLDALRATDLAVRWGGEEFLLVLAGDDAQVPVERLRLAVAASAVEAASGQALTFSFSAGWTEVRENDTVESLMERADAALYRAKQAGRDRVEHA